MTLLPADGQRFGRYRLGRRLGHGGMGVVHAATDTVLGREVALKLVTPHLADDPDFRSRFVREATLLARLDSPHIVSIFDHGEQEGVLYIATQLIDGGDLAALMHSGPLAPAAAVDLVDQVAEALTDAHEVGVVHRDVKPANLLIRRKGGRVEAFLCDFGIATAADARITRTGGVSGSLSWMAPERHQGEDAGAAGDVYSTGCLLWYALTGAAPYTGTDVEIAMGHLHGAVPQLPGSDPLSARINVVLSKAMAKQPHDRYADAAALHADLAALRPLASGAVALPDVTSIRQPLALAGAATAVPDPARRRRRGLIWLGAVAATLALVGGTVGVWSARANQHPGDHAAQDDPSLASDASSPAASSTGATGPSGRSAHDHAAGDGPGAADGRTASTRGPDAGPASPGDNPASGTTKHATQPHSGATRNGTSGSTRPSTAASPAATSAAPAYNYRCWNGTLTYQYSSCTTPYGATGESWMFLGTTCTANPGGFADTTADVEVWTCSVKGSDGKSDYLALARWSSATAAHNYFNGWYGANKHTSSWTYGPVQYGTHPAKDYTRYRFSREWNTLPWTMSVSASSDADRQALIKRVQGYRPPGNWRGVSCSSTTAC